MTPTPRGWHPGGDGLLCHQRAHKPTKSTSSHSGFARPVTLTEGNDAAGLLLLETWDLPLVVPYGAFGCHGNAIEIYLT